MFLKFCAINAQARVLFPRHFEVFFPHHYCRFLLFSLLFHVMKAEIVCARAQVDFLRSSGPHSVKQIAKFLKKRPNEGLTSGQKDLRRQTKECTAVSFDELCEKLNRKS